MLPMLTSPFHSWDAPIDSPSRVNIPSYSDDSQPFTYVDAVSLRELAKVHFKPGSITSAQLRSGYNHVCLGPDVGNEQNKQKKELVLSIVSKGFKEPLTSYPNEQQEKLRSISSCLRLGRYKTAIRETLEAMNTKKDIALVPMLGLIAAICARNDKQEQIFFDAAERAVLAPDDLPQYQKIIDELMILDKSPQQTPILKLILGNTAELEKAICEKTRIYPKIGFDFQKILTRLDIYTKANSPLYKLEELLIVKATARKSLPPLVPVGEGFGPFEESDSSNKKLKNRSKSKSKSQKPQQNYSSKDKITTLLEKKEWKAAAAACTEILQTNSNNAEVLQHRSFALMNLGKIHDAICDVTRAIAIKQTDIRLRLRAALWLMLGERQLCVADLAMLEQRDESETLIKAMDQPDPGLRGAKQPWKLYSSEISMESV